VENLGKHKRGLTVINKQLTNNKDNDTIILWVWLAIGTNKFVLDLLEWKGHQLVDDVLGSLELFTLESEERLLTVKRTESGAVGVESIVVMLDELATDRVELGVHLEISLY